MRYGICALLCLSVGGFAWDLSDLARCAWERNPRLSEDSVALMQARNNYDKVKYGAILPRFQAGIAFGPAPGFRYNIDSTLRVSRHGDSIYVRDSSTSYAWDHWGPYFGTEISLAQPLNVQQLRTGLAAARGGIVAEEAGLQGKRQGYLKEATEYYLSYVYARTMVELLEPALRKLDQADSSLQAKLDADDESVKQSDLLQLRAERLRADEGIDEAHTALERAEKGLRFVLRMAPEDSLLIADKELFQFADLPSLDSLKQDLRHPDLRRLQAGIDAKRALLEYHKAAMGPTIAIFAQLDYTKAWVANRSDQGRDVLVTDPINTLTGKVGLGFTWDLNVWSKKREVTGARLELDELRRKEAYARPGIESRLSEAYARYRSAGRRVALVAKARDAAESWLKGVALQVDADSSRERELVGPYQKTIDLQHQYWEAVYQRDMLTLEVLQAVGWLEPGELLALKPVPVVASPAKDDEDSEEDAVEPTAVSAPVPEASEAPAEKTPVSAEDE